MAHPLRGSRPITPRLFSRLRQLPRTHPRLGLLLRVSAWAATLGYFAFALLLLALRYAILPQIESYRGDIEQMIGTAINRPVGIRRIETHWAGLRPALTLEGFEIRDTSGRPALGFDEVEAELSWSSLWHFQLRLARLELNAPILSLRRDREGRIFAAGLEITPDPATDEEFADWLLVQDSVIVRDAAITWQDDLRRAPPLELKHLNFQLDNSFGRHRFGLTADPPRQLAARIDIRGNFKGRDFDQLEAWKGEAYAELDYADLAVWKHWVDYPVNLPQGSGALRIWLGFAGKQLQTATADVRLADVRLQLRRDLPELDMVRLEGRIAGRRIEQGFDVELKRLTMATRDGVDLAPLDLKLAWQDAVADRPPQGRASANGLDLASMANLAAHLPFDNATRDRLARHAPRGRVYDLKLEWKGSRENPKGLQTWSVSSRFEGLGLTALGPIPGMSGINGRVDGSEKGGSVQLNGQRAAVELPTVFADPTLDVEAFAADLAWTSGADGTQVRINEVTFHNKDAAGDVKGVWRSLPEGPGALDLHARLTRGSGNAAWRYMPLAVSTEVRDWLRTSISGGKATDTTLTLRGDLRQFPFRDGKGGIFEVRGKFHDTNLRYADDWPEITNIEGELLFSGQRMLITGKSGRIFGVGVRDVRAEIADIEQPEELLTVSGNAAGATNEFLRFIESSALGERIDHFTRDMQAEGTGTLDLKLSLPLRKMHNSKVDGVYRFEANRLTVGSDFPPIGDLRGSMRFSADQIEARNIRGVMLGAPLSVDVRTASDGGVQINAAGEYSVAALRRQMSHSAVLDHLSGAAKWTGSVLVKDKSAEVKLSSNLVGLTSSLPEPFNKSAADVMPLNFERRLLPAAAPARVPARAAAGPAQTAAPAPTQDTLNVSIGRAWRLQLVRRIDSTPPAIVRGVVAMGDISPAMPDRGLLFAVALPRIDVNAWGKFWPNQGDGSDQAAALLPTLPALMFDVRTAELAVHDRSFHDVRINGSHPEGASSTRFDLQSRELAGNFEWDAAAGGKLTGRIGQFAIPEAAATPAALQAKASEVLDRFPALDITIDQLSFKERQLGTVRIAAENKDGYWNTRVDAKNEDGALESTGRWRLSATQPDTRIEFKLSAKSIEKFLARAGYPDTVRRGSANLTGNLSWNGTPFSIGYPTLAGNLRLDAANGQFVKLEPGVGRLLGVLSLQSLPRRITLDFRDVFSEGFAFDSITGQVAVARGVMDTRDLQIQGPSAKVLMSGTVDLAGETQDLKVRVQPAVGDTVAIGAMIANPVAGAVVWAAQKILKDPIDQAFAFEYAVTGSWDDPKVEKLGQPPKAAEEKK